MRKQARWIKSLTVLLTFFLMCGGTPFMPVVASKEKVPRNVILLIGDGMGQSYMTAYRYFKNEPFANPMKATVFDPFLVGSQMTYSSDPDENVTDSAAAATAMSAGIKTYNGAIGVDMDKAPVETVLERAKKMGKSTGMVVTTEVTHATPASFAAHNDHRDHADAIANDYFDRKINGNHVVDVLMGGGSCHFERQDRNLVEEFKASDYDVVRTRKELRKSKSQRLLGLFAKKSLPKMIDRKKKTPSLKEMTLSAIERLSRNEKGFFLMVEGSQIDFSGHNNDVVAAMSEMEDFAQAFQAAIDFAQRDQNTLVIATADHSTGGLSIGSGGVYEWNPTPIHQVKRTPSIMACEIRRGADVEEVLKKYIEFPLTEEEIENIKKASSSYSKAIRKVIDARTHTGWTTGNHTGEDVPVYAMGPGKECFFGLHDNTEIAKNLFRFFGSP